MACNFPTPLDTECPKCGEVHTGKSGGMLPILIWGIGITAVALAVLYFTDQFGMRSWVGKRRADNYYEIRNYQRKHDTDGWEPEW